jgi:hypothetical protein
MRWIRERAQSVVQLRCVDANGPFAGWALGRLRSAAAATGKPVRLPTNKDAKLPT